MRKIYFLMMTLMVIGATGSTAVADTRIPIIVMGDLSEVIITSELGNHHFKMNDGIAWWPAKCPTRLEDASEKSLGIFTRKALERVWREKELSLICPFYSSKCYPPGLEGGMYMAGWDDESGEGFMAPVMFNPLGVNMDMKGNPYHTGTILIKENSRSWLNKKGESKEWQP